MAILSFSCLSLTTQHTDYFSKKATATAFQADISQ